ncbi:unnamed protein product [Allacma fusca]|uniref:Uncharacterized protein n=1 Tax=Allacma fusca TaxID=39272 RepID=A0A8J2M583_9HEXA|nr:unnamed protein product [Allacma fusca]
MVHGADGHLIEIVERNFSCCFKVFKTLTGSPALMQLTIKRNSNSCDMIQRGIGWKAKTRVDSASVCNTSPSIATSMYVDIYIRTDEDPLAHGRRLLSPPSQVIISRAHGDNQENNLGRSADGLQLNVF